MYCESYNPSHDNAYEFTLSIDDVDYMRNLVYSIIKGKEVFINEYIKLDSNINLLLNGLDPDLDITVITASHDDDIQSRIKKNKNLVTEFLNRPLTFYFDYNYLFNNTRIVLPARSEEFKIFDVNSNDFRINEMHHRKFRIILKDILRLRDIVDAHSDYENEYKFNYIIKNFESFIPDTLIPQFLVQLNHLASKTNTKFILLADNEETTYIIEDEPELTKIVNY